MKIIKHSDTNEDLIFIQMSDIHEEGMIEKEISLIKEMTQRKFGFVVCMADDWNRDLSPWGSPAVFGDEPFGGRGSETLDELLRMLGNKRPGQKMILGGYSLAGLFALWASYKSDMFDGIAAASPSVWYPDFLAFTRENEIKTNVVYLSLGDKEEKTKNPVMRTVGDAIRALYAQYKDTDGIKTMLEWNEGNHFKEPDLRMAKSFAWCIGNV